MYLKVRDFVKDNENKFGFTITEDKSISSKFVELFFTMGYKSFVSIADTSETLFLLWQFYLEEMLPQLIREYDAMTRDYNPIENYNMVESGTDSDTTTNNLTMATNTTNNVGSATSTVIDSSVPFDSATYKATGKTETTDSARTDSNTSNATNTGTVQNNKTHSFTRSGNIGISTASDMIEKELRIRKVSVLRDFLKGFAERYFFIDLCETFEPCGFSLTELVEEILRRLPKAESEVF